MPMKIKTLSRYGYSEEASGKRACAKLIRELVRELGEEQFSRPDVEHQEVGVTNADDWSISILVRGDIRLEHLERGTPRRYLFNLPAEELVDLLLDLASGDMSKVFARRWSTKRDRPFYLYASRPKTPDLIRAVACGDVEWVKAEIATGADVNVRDTHFGSPLHHAALCGWIDVCRVLLDAGADPTLEIDGETPAGHARGADEYLHDKEAVAELVALLEEAAKQKK